MHCSCSTESKRACLLFQARKSFMSVTCFQRKKAASSSPDAIMNRNCIRDPANPFIGAPTLCLACGISEQSFWTDASIDFHSGVFPVF